MTQRRGEAATQDPTADIAGLLQAAADSAWDQADADGPRSARYGVAMSIHLLACEALALLPAEAVPAPTATGETDPVRLLVAAEQMMQTLPVEQQPAGMSALVLQLGELIRQVSQ